MEPLQDPGVGGEVPPHHLEGEALLQGPMDRFVDPPRAPFAQEALHSKTIDRSAHPRIVGARLVGLKLGAIHRATAEFAPEERGAQRAEAHVFQGSSGRGNVGR